MRQLEASELELLAQSKKNKDLQNNQTFQEKINSLSPTKVRNVITPRIV
jgi:hypothetical protein